ncbi:MAG: preprotein translocase subunit SecY, partial [Candidatus Micrarchaeia archaeon]
MLEKLDPILKFIPSIKKPSTPLSFKEKLKWTGMIMTVYFLLFSIPAYGVNMITIKSGLYELMSIVFASRIGSLITVGIGPIVL